MPRIPELKQFYREMADQQRMLIDSIRPLTPEQMQLRPAPTEWAIWQLCANMAGGRLYWLCFMLGKDDRGLSANWTGWEDAPDHPRTADETVAALEKTWSVVEDCLDRWTLADLDVPVTTKDWWGNEVTITPAWVIARLLTHEVHHGSEVTLILRVHGLPFAINR